MMGIDEIRRMNKEAAERAAAAGSRPFGMNDDDFVVTIEDIDNGRGVGGFAFPALAPEYVEELYPGEYELIDTFFTDKGQFSLTDAGGPAHSIKSFSQAALDLIREKNESLYFTIHDEGQFQLYISAFRRSNVD
jgi:hypothetical protein